MNTTEFCRRHKTLATYFTYYFDDGVGEDTLNIKGAVKEGLDYYMYYEHIHKNKLECRRSRIYWNANNDVYFYLNSIKIDVKDILRRKAVDIMTELAENHHIVFGDHKKDAEQEITERERVENWLRFGECGNFVANDENGREIVRLGTTRGTLPDCRLYENGKIVGDNVLIWDAVDFLYGK